jgi:hypothetical protein
MVEQKGIFSGKHEPVDMIAKANIDNMEQEVEMWKNGVKK